MSARPATIVLDNEAIQALADAAHPKHRRALSFVEVARQRNLRRTGRVALVVPVAVRVEADWDRTNPSAELVNRLWVTDIDLRPPRVDRAVRLRGRTGVSVVDATVGEAAMSADEPVVILTSDGRDMTRLAALTDNDTRVVRL
jgi:hypothetical protein